MSDCLWTRALKSGDGRDRVAVLNNIVQCGLCLQVGNQLKRLSDVLTKAGPGKAAAKTAEQKQRKIEDTEGNFSGGKQKRKGRGNNDEKPQKPKGSKKKQKAAPAP